MIFKRDLNVPNTVHNKPIKCVKHEDELDTHHEKWSLHNDEKTRFLIFAIFSNHVLIIIKNNFHYFSYTLDFIACIKHSNDIQI